MASIISITLNDTKYDVKRAKLRHWLSLEEIKENLNIAAESGNNDGITQAIYSYISSAMSVSVELEELPWYEVTNTFHFLADLNSPTIDFPFLKSAFEFQKMPWDYEDRAWYIWLHLLAEKNNWNIEYIAELDIDEAIGLSQEIAIEQQLQREWEWQLTELAYPYDEATKKANFKPLPRPAWMSPAPKVELDKVHKIKSNLMPMGVILRWDQTNEAPPA